MIPRQTLEVTDIKSEPVDIKPEPGYQPCQSDVKTSTGVYVNEDCIEISSAAEQDIKPEISFCKSSLLNSMTDMCKSETRESHDPAVIVISQQGLFQFSSIVSVYNDSTVA